MSVFNNAVAIAHKITKSLKAQSKVSYQRMTAVNEYGATTYAAPVLLDAVVEPKQKQIAKLDGTFGTSKAVITLLDVVALSKATNGAGVGVNDVFTLADGTTGPILTIRAPILDPETNKRLMTEVYLG